MKMDYDREYFKGKAIVVTGAASGIGLALSQALLEAGAIVTMADWNQDLLRESAESLVSYADRLHTARADVSKQEEVHALIQEAATRHGRLDMLFNNAGIAWAGSVHELSLKIWKQVIDINLWGVIYGIDAAIPIMSRQNSGHIVNTASIWGLVPAAYETPYVASKHAVVGLSESLRYQLEPEGIFVSVCCPGAVATCIYGEYEAPPEAISPEQAAVEILAGVARREGIIVVTDPAKALWQYYRTDSVVSDGFLRNQAREQRDKYADVKK